MKRKHKRPHGQDQAADEARELAYRLENLLLICSRVEVRMSDSFVYEVWGRLRHGPKRLGLLPLGAARHSLHAAVGQALVAAVELERPFLPAASPAPEAKQEITAGELARAVDELRANVVAALGHDPGEAAIMQLFE